MSDTSASAVMNQRLRMASSSALRVVYSADDESDENDDIETVSDDPPAMARSESQNDLFQPVNPMVVLGPQHVPAVPPRVRRPPIHRPGQEFDAFEHHFESTLPCPEDQLPAFALKPVPPSQEIKCKISRKRAIASGGRSYPSYELYIQDEDREVFLLSARKRNYISKSSHYVISTKRLNECTGDSVVAHVRSNFIGTAFSIHDNAESSSKMKFGVHEEFGAVLYEPNILGVKGPRKMTVILPAMSKDGQRVPLRPQNERETLLLRGRQDIDNTIHVMHNKTPQWNAETESFVLNFNTRVTMASVKNFQIVHDHDLDYILMQFGRVESDKFTMDFKYPMTAVQAFGIALTSFDAKLAENAQFLSYKKELAKMATLSADAKVAYEDVRNDSTPTNWLLLEYADDKSDNIILSGSGNGGLEEAKTKLDDNKPAFGFVRVVVGNDELSQRVKFLFFTWCGSGVKVMRKAKLSIHIANVKQVLQTFSVEVSATTLDDLKESEMVSLIKKSMGANYDGQGSR
ncbi:hypothetical protein HDU77_003440 [Chytriomyces hyalinus]|nr:hypothetical protein HDU77_003440 [Chytriomyces hyalinus]